MDLVIIKLDDETYKEVMNRTEFDTLVLGIKLIEAVQNGTSLEEELRKLRLQIHNIEEPDHDFEGFYQCQDEAIEIISKAIDELKGEK